MAELKKSEQNRSTKISTHGCIHGSFEVVNVPNNLHFIRLRLGLYTNDTNPRRHHVHRLLWTQFSLEAQDFIEVDVGRDNGYKFNLNEIAIIHSGSKIRSFPAILFKKMKKMALEKKALQLGDSRSELTDAEELTLKTDIMNFIKEIKDNLNTVALGFEAFQLINGKYYPLCPTKYSNGIGHKSNSSTGMLKIRRHSPPILSGSVLGGEEIMILVDQVKKDDIEVKFFQLNEKEEKIWEARASFDRNTDIHFLYAIVFRYNIYFDIVHIFENNILARTPPYFLDSVTEDVKVWFELYRPSDGAVSCAKVFTYTPTQAVRLILRA